MSDHLPVPATVVATTDRPKGSHSGTSERCHAWTISNDNVAAASIETFCARFGPCPNSIAEAGAKEPFGAPPLVSATERGLWLSYGTLDGQEYAFDRKGKLVGASVWREAPFGDCDKQATRYRGGRVDDIGTGETLERCGFVPGRDLLRSRACTCERPKDRPTRIGLDRGPQIEISLDCLYEFGLAGEYCPRQLAAARQQPDAKASDLCHGCVRISTRSLDSDCIYDSSGELREIRIGKRFKSLKFGTSCREPTSAQP